MPTIVLQFFLPFGVKFKMDWYLSMQYAQFVFVFDTTVTLKKEQMEPNYSLFFHPEEKIM